MTIPFLKLSKRITRFQDEIKDRMTGGLNTAFLKNWSTPVELSPVSDTMTAGYTPELAEKGRTQVLRDKLLQLRDNLLQGMTAQELAGWGYNSEKSMKEAGIIKGNEYLDYNQTPIKPETVVKLRIQARPMSEYETMQTATGLKDPVGIMDFLNTPSMKAGDFDIAPADIINLAALAFGGVQALRGGQASFNRATFKSGLQREANARGVTLAKDEVDAVTGWAERNVKPSTLTKNGLNELYSKVFGYGKPVPPKYGTVPRTPPQPSALTQLTKTNTAVPGQTQSLVDILRGITGKVPATAQAAQGVVNLAGQPKQPWQMRQGEFIESALSEYTGSERATQRQFATESIKTTHRQTVEKALAEGKPVPESVLKDYPELQASTQQAVTKNQLNLLDELHNHSIRQKGSLQSTDDEIADYIRKLHDYVDKYAPRYMPKLQAAIRENEEGERTLASVGFDNVLNRLHEDAKYTIPSTQDAVAIASKARRNLFDVADQITQPSQPLSPSTSVQTGLAGIGPETAQAQMFGEVSGKTSSKQPLVDVERIKQQQAAPSEPIGLITPEPPPTPPAAPPIQPPSSGGQPPTPPTPPAQPVQPSNAPIPSGKGIEFGDLQDAETVARISFKQDISRKISNLPVIKQALKTLNPSSVASTPAEQGIVIRAVLRDEAKYKTQGIIAYLNKLGSQEKVFGKLDKNGLISSGVLKGKSVNDIRQYPDKYNLTKEQKAWVKAADDIEKAKLKYLRDNDIEVKELSFEEGGQYAGRRVYGMITSDGELLDTAFIGVGPSRVGAKASFEKVRVFKTADEAIKAGYRYLPDDEALALNVQAAYNKVADKRFVEWTLNRIPWRSTGAPDELVLAADTAKIRLHKAKQLLASLNRTLRGERGVPEQIVNSISSVFPNEANELKTLIADIRAGGKTGNRVQDFTRRANAILNNAKSEYYKAVNVRARAREKAMTPSYNESMLFHPSFQGKVFTGDDAKKTAETLRNALEPKLNSALEAMDKLNAVARYFKLAGDMSSFGIQLLFLAGQNPIIYGKAFAGSVNALFSPEFQSKYLIKKKTVIDRHPNLIISKSGTEFTEALARGGFLRQGIMKIAGNVLSPFQRGFEAALDYAGIEMAESLEHLAKTPEQIAEIDQFINEFRGLTSTAKLGVTPGWRSVETAVLLAPRYNRAIAALLYDAVRGSAFQGGLRGRLAMNGLARGVMAVIAMFIATGFALGKDWDEIQETLDPTSSKFLTYNIGGVNIGPGTKIRSVTKTIAEMFENPDDIFEVSMDNPFMRFVRGNLSPVLSSGIDILTGRNYIGDPVRDNWKSFLKEEVLSQFIPIWLENVVMEGGTLGQRLLRGTGEFFGGRTYPETTNDVANRLYERYSAQDYGKKYEELNESEKDELKRNHEDLAEAIDLNEKYWAERGDSMEQNAEIIEKQLIEQRNNNLNNAAQAFRDDKITKYDYDKERSRIRPYYSGGMQVLYAMRDMEKSESDIKSYQKYLEVRKPEDKALDEYFNYYGELLEQSDLPVDFDVITNELQSFLNKYSPEIQKYITENKDAWIQDLPEPARSVELERLQGIEDESWWDDYRGTKKPTQRYSLEGEKKPAATTTPAKRYKLPWEK